MLFVVCGLMKERLGNFSKDARPVAGGGLAEELHGGVPRGVIAVDHPAPVGAGGEQGPDGAGQRAGDVDDAGVDGDDQVQHFEESGSFGEAGQVGAEICDGHFPAQHRCGRPLLE